MQVKGRHGWYWSTECIGNWDADINKSTDKILLCILVRVHVLWSTCGIHVNMPYRYLPVQCNSTVVFKYYATSGECIHNELLTYSYKPLKVSSLHTLINSCMQCNLVLIIACIYSIPNVWSISLSLSMFVFPVLFWPKMYSFISFLLTVFPLQFAGFIRSDRLRFLIKSHMPYI